MPGEYSKYYTGEAYWALARLHRAFPGEGWGEAADRIGAYLATSRDEVEDHWPPIPDHWAAYGAAETVEFPERGRPPLTEDEVDYARRQAGLFGVAGRWVAQRFGPWGEVVRGSDTPRGGGYGVMSEALTGLVAGGPGGAPAGRPARADRRTRHVHRRTGAGGAIRRRGRRGCRPAGAGGGRVVPRRRDPHGRPAARACRAAANDPDRRGARPGSRPTPAMTHRRAGCGRPCCCWRSIRPGPRSRSPARGRTPPSAVGVAAAGGAIGGLAVCRRRGRGRSAARRARCQRALVPRRRRDRGRAGRRHRPVPPTTRAGARAARLARRARPRRDPRGGSPGAAGGGHRRGRRPGRPRERRRDGGRASRC